MGARTAQGRRGEPMLGLLYESDEWSDHKLAAELEALGVPVRLLDMEDAASEQAALGCEMLVGRVFASAQFRGHAASLERMARLARTAEQRGIVLVNPGRAHFFEVDKRRATETLAAAGLVTPAVYACAPPAGIDAAALAYPCVLKPNCGGRTTCTAIARSADEARAFLAEAPAIELIAEEYVEPARGFLTRIEVVDGACALAVKRSVADNGLSAYRFGSTYAAYPDVPRTVTDAAERGATVLSIELGSFDVIEGARGPCLIDANSVSNVSEDCTELLGMDLMRAHAEAVARRWHALGATAPHLRERTRPC